MNFEEWFDNLINDLVSNKIVAFGNRDAARAAWEHQQKRIDELKETITNQKSELGKINSLVYVQKRIIGNFDLQNSIEVQTTFLAQQKNIDRLEKENAELIGMMKNNHAYHGDNNSWKCNDDSCVGCMIERRKEYD